MTLPYSLCQCPLGLVPHCYGKQTVLPLVSNVIVSMPSRASTSLLPLALAKYISVHGGRCQCPLGLVPHCYSNPLDIENGFRTVSMPSRASTSLLRKEKQKNFTKLFRVSMPSRASTSLLQYPFKNLGFMRFP